MKKLKRPDTGVLIGLIAILINVITVSVYIRQTAIMQREQHAAVWPYLEWRVIYNQNEGFMLRVTNNGIGPALVRESTMRLEGEVMTDLDALFTRMIDTTMFPHLRAPVENRVLPPGEAIDLIRTENALWAEKLYGEFTQRDFELDICYESIYGDQWLCTGSSVTESDCD